MSPTDGSAPLPMAKLIAATVALDEALAREQYPQARHHARMVALRGEKNGFTDVSECAAVLMTVLGQAIRPSRVAWHAALARLHDAIEQALDTSTHDA